MKQVNVSVSFGTVIKSKVIKSLKDDGGSLNLSEHNNYYAHLPAITAGLEGDACPLLRAILLQDLGCESIDEVSGEGSTWWDFTYKDVWFTVQLLVPSCGGSILYPRSCTRSSTQERQLLEEVANRIAEYAKLRTTIKLERANAAYQIELRSSRWCCGFTILAAVFWLIDSAFHDNLFLALSIAFAIFAAVAALVWAAAALLAKWCGKRGAGR